MDLQHQLNIFKRAYTSLGGVYLFSYYKKSRVLILIGVATNENGALQVSPSLGRHFLFYKNQGG